jgi:hypothetical protein
MRAGRNSLLSFYRSISHRELVDAFWAWRSFVQRSRRNLLVSSNAAARVSTRSLRHALLAWREGVGASKAEADLASEVLQGWRDFAARKRTTREVGMPVLAWSLYRV